jgi:arylsulfatase A-like enzyme
LFGDEAVRVIDRHDQSKPLFLYLAFTAPHSPYQAPQSDLDKYLDIKDAARQAYAAQISAMDDAIGKVVGALDARGMRDNTLIVFASDNGGTRSPKFAGQAAVKSVPPDNGPFRDGKGSNYEGGTRVVAIANWPGVIKPGAVDGMIHMVDFYPTLARLAGGSLAKTKPLDGLDVWETISTGVPSPRTELVYNVEPFRAAIREGDWKLVWSPTLPPRAELYDLSKDPYEQHDAASEHPDKVRQMQDRLVELAKQASEPLFLMDLVRIGVSVGPVFPGDTGVPPEQD